MFVTLVANMNAPVIRRIPRDPGNSMLVQNKIFTTEALRTQRKVFVCREMPASRQAGMPADQQAGIPTNKNTLPSNQTKTGKPLDEHLSRANALAGPTSPGITL
jgi:hypothetical protein